MKAIHTIKNFAKRLVIASAITLGANSAWGAAGDEITSYANIVSGKWYYIKGVRTNGTIDYLSFTDAPGDAVAGTSVSTTGTAVPLNFTYESSNWYITTPNGYYVSPATNNGKLVVTTTQTSVTITDNGGLISIQVDSYYLQKNKTAVNFGGYNGGQNYISLIEATTYSVSWSVNGGACGGSPTTIALAGHHVSKLPTTPTTSDCDNSKVFVGWSATSLLSPTDTRPSDLFRDADQAPIVNANVTYYAVFATPGSPSNLLSENFSSISTGNSTTTGGSGTAWSYNSNFSGSSSAYQAGGAVRLGGSGSVGYLITKELPASVGEVLTISFSVKGWTTVECNLAVTGNNSEFTAPGQTTYTSAMSGSFQSKSLDVILTTANPKVKIATTGGRAFIDDISITKNTYTGYATNCVTCSDNVTLSKGSETNGTLALGTASIGTCSDQATDRQVTISLSLASSTGYDAPATLAWTQTSGTTFSAPTLVSGPTLNGNTYDYVYQFPQNVSGSGTFGVSCIALTNYRTSCCTDPQLTFGTIASPVTSYTITREDLASASTYGTVAIAAESNSPATIGWIQTLRPATPCLGQAIWRAGSGNDQSPTGQFYVDMANNQIKSKTSGVYIVTITQAADASTGVDYCEVTADVTVTVKTIDKFIDAVNGNFSGLPQSLEDLGCGILLPTEETYTTNNACHSTTRRLIGWIKASDLATYASGGRVDMIDDLKTGDASNKVIAPGTRVTATGITWYAVWGEEVTP